MAPTEGTNVNTSGKGAIPAGPAHAKGGKPPGRPKNPVVANGKKRPKCGALTRTCECGHHKRVHAGRTGRCWQCGETCEAFKAKPCKSDKAMRNGRCRMHGGSTPAGIASPNWKTGRWAKGIRNTSLRNHFYAALGDPDLQRTQQDVALADAMLSSLLKTLPEGEPITDVQERRLSKLVELRQNALERQARIEQRLGLWIHFTKYQTVMMGMVNVLHEELRTPEGQMDVLMLGRVQKRVEALMVGLTMDQQALGTGEEDAEG